MKKRKVIRPYRASRQLSWRRGRLYMRKIERFNQSADVCWTELVCWDAVDRGTSLATLVNVENVAHCKQDAARNGTCYCGKFATLEKADVVIPAFIVEASR